MVSTALRPQADFSPAIEELIYALLSSFVTSICMPSPGFPFDEHNNFIGKKRLKSLLVELLPLREFAQVGLNCDRVRQFLGELFKAGLVEKLVLEAKRRKNDGVEPGQWSARTTTVEASTNRSPAFFTNSSGTMQASQCVSVLRRANIEQATSRSGATYGPGPSFVRSMADNSWPSDHNSCVPRLKRQHSKSDVTGYQSASPDKHSGLQLFIQLPDTKPHFLTNHNSVRRAPPTLSPSSECPLSRSPQSQSPSPTPSVDGSSRTIGLEKCGNTHTLLPLYLRLQLLATLQRKLESTCYYFAKTNRFHAVFFRKPDWELCANAAELQQWCNELIRELKHHRGVNSSSPYAGDMITVLSSLVSLRHDAVHRNAVTERILAHIGRALEFVRLVQTWPQEGGTKDRADNSSTYQPSHMHLDSKYLSKLQRDLLAVQEAIRIIIREEDAKIMGQLFNNSFVLYPGSGQHGNLGEPYKGGGAESNLKNLTKSLWDFVIDRLGEELALCQLQRSCGVVDEDTTVH